MGLRNANNTYFYVIDKDDRIISVSDNWLTFAQENNAAETCHPNKIINKSLWHFIDGIETTQLYKLILNNVRKQNKSITLPYRCDAPDKRRYLELTITPIQLQCIEFISCIVHEEPRAPIAVLNPNRARSADFIKICSLCKKVELPQKAWTEVENAVIALRLFENDTMPQLSHGLCPECFALGMQDVEKCCT